MKTTTQTATRVSTLLAEVTVDQPLVKTLTPIEQYRRYNAQTEAMGRIMREATANVGYNWSRDEKRTNRAWLVTGGVTALAAVSAFFGLDQLVLAAASGVGAAVAAGVPSHLIASRKNQADRARPVSDASLQELQALLADTIEGSAEAVALGVGAKSWLQQLDKQDVKGWRVRLMLEKFEERAASAPATSVEQNTKWQNLRSWERRINGNAGNFLRAFAALTDDERRSLAPALREQLFDGEVPRAHMSTSDAQKVHGELTTWIGDDAATPLPELTHLKDLPEPAAKADFDRAIRLRDTCKIIIDEIGGTTEKQVTPDDLVKLVAYVDAPGLSAGEAALLGRVTRGLIPILDNRAIYGSDARRHVNALADAATAQSDTANAWARNMLKYLEVLDHSPKHLFTAHNAVENAIEAVNNLGPDNRAAGAERVLSRFFKGETPYGGESATMRKLGIALTKML